MATERRYRPLGSGLPGKASFGVADLAANDVPVWDSITERWITADLGDYYTASEVDDLISGEDPTSLFYLTDEHVTAVSDGAEIRRETSGTTYLHMYGEASDLRLELRAGSTDIVLHNFDHGGAFFVTAENTGGAVNTLIHGKPNSSVDLYYTGTLAFRTDTVGAQASRISGSTTSLILASAGAVAEGAIVSTSSSSYLYNYSHGGVVQLWSEDAGGTARKCFEGDGDMGVVMYYAGNIAATVYEAGIRTRRNSGSTTVYRLEDSSGTPEFAMVSDATRGYMYSYSHGGLTQWYAENAGGSGVIGFEFDPDSNAVIRHAGAIMISTTSNGFTIDNTQTGIFVGSGTPEGAITSVVGSLYLRTDGGAGTTLYVKQSGSGNTGWVGK